MYSLVFKYIYTSSFYGILSLSISKLLNEKV